ncbi:MAG: hypothetical protein ACKON7_11225, partial [Planctomycetaceae bacterium]
MAGRITVRGPIVDLDGDEMTRIIWHVIKDRLILPSLDVDIRTYDLSIQNRDATADQVTIDAAHAVRGRERERERAGARDAGVGRAILV